MGKRQNTPIDLVEQSAPSTPAAGRVSLYAKSDGKAYIKDDAGTETDLTATGSGGGNGTAPVSMVSSGVTASATGTSLVVDSSGLPGDLIVAQIALGNGDVPDTPEGWSYVTYASPIQNGVGIHTYYRTWQPGDDALTWTWTWDNSIKNSVTWWMFRSADAAAGGTWVPDAISSATVTSGTSLNSGTTSTLTGVNSAAVALAITDGDTTAGTITGGGWTDVANNTTGDTIRGQQTPTTTTALAAAFSWTTSSAATGVVIVFRVLFGYLLAERDTVPTPPGGSTVLFADSETGRVASRSDKGGDAFADFRRANGYELRHWRAALAGRLERPANVYIVGDSLEEGEGVSAFDKVWVDIMRDGLQRWYKRGGEGWIPFTQGAAISVPNRWTNAGSPDLTDYGLGHGRRGILHNSLDDISTLTAYCDKFWLVYFINNGAGAFKVTIDGVVAAASVSANLPFSLGGNIWTSPDLPLGTHTIRVEPVGALNSYSLEGVMLFATDGPTAANPAGTGIHVWNGGHSGYTAANFAEGANGRSWPSIMYQAAASFDSGGANVTANGTTTLVWTGTSPAFTADDIGEVVFAGIDNTNFPTGVRINSVTNATTVVVNKVIPAGSHRLAYTRARVTDAVRTSGVATITSANADFHQADRGKTISGTGIQAGTTIRKVVSESTIEVSPYPTSTGSGTLQIKNRQASGKYTRPDLLLITLGGNDLGQGYSAADFKANMEALVQVVTDVGQLDVPGMGNGVIVNDERPSVMLKTGPASSIVFSAPIVVSTLSGSNIVSKATTGTIREVRFHPADVGKTISCIHLPGTSSTIIEMYGTPNANGLYDQVKIDENAVTTSTNVAATIVNREAQEAQFLDLYQAIFELVKENKWALFDMFNIFGTMGQNDPLGLVSKDNTHPIDRGHQAIADEAAWVIGGIPRIASIDQGIFDTAGEMIVAAGPDLARKAPGKKIMQADVSTGTSVGTYVNLTDLSFPIGPNEELTFLFWLHHVAAAATSGFSFRLNKTDIGGLAMSTPALFVMSMIGMGNAASTFVSGGTNVEQAWPQVALTILGSGTGTAPTVSLIRGTVKAGAVGGLIVPQVTPEIAAAVTIQRGSDALIL